MLALMNVNKSEGFVMEVLFLYAVIAVVDFVNQMPFDAGFNDEKTLLRGDKGQKLNSNQEIAALANKLMEDKGLKGFSAKTMKKRISQVSKNYAFHKIIAHLKYSPNLGRKTG